MWHQSKEKFSLAVYELEDLKRMVLGEGSNLSEHDVFGNHANFGYDVSVYLATSTAEGDYILSTEISTPDIYEHNDTHLVSLEVVSSEASTVRAVTERIRACATEIIEKRPALEARV